MYTGIILLALALTFVAPITASARPFAMEMLREQVASQTMIRSLTGNLGSSSQYVEWIWFGNFTPEAAEAHIPVYVHLRGGPNVNGVLELRKWEGNWYFYSITRGTEEGDVSQVAIPGGITYPVVYTAISEQRNHQWITQGILNGGYKKLTVLSRTNNWGTSTVKVKLSRGTRHSVMARMTALRKTATNGNKYWFLLGLKYVK